MWRSRSSQETPADVDDSALIQRFESVNASFQPGDPDAGRRRLLREVARQRDSAPSFNGRSPMFGYVLAHKGLALIAAGVLSVGAVGAVGASGGAGVMTDGVGEVLAALNIKEKAAEESHEHIDAIEHPELPGAAASSEDASADGVEKAGGGIDNSNASETGLENAADNAFEGAGNADGALDSLPEQVNDLPVTPELPEAATEALDGIDPEIPEVELPDAAGGAPVPR